MTITKGFGFTLDTQTGHVERWAFAGERTGHPPGMLQDDSRELTAWLSGKPDAMRHARDAVAKIRADRGPCRCGPDGCSDSGCAGRVER